MTNRRTRNGKFLHQGIRTSPQESFTFRSATTFLANLFLGSPFHFWPSPKPCAAFRRSPCANLAPFQVIWGVFHRPFRLSIALVSQRIAPNCSEPAHAETHIRQRVVRASSKPFSSSTLVLMRAAKSQTATRALFSETENQRFGLRGLAVDARSKMSRTVLGKASPCRNSRIISTNPSTCRRTVTPSGCAVTRSSTRSTI